MRVNTVIQVLTYSCTETINLRLVTKTRNDKHSSKRKMLQRVNIIWGQDCFLTFVVKNTAALFNQVSTASHPFPKPSPNTVFMMAMSMTIYS